MDHPSHKLSAYLDDRVWVTFCKLCSAEGNFLAEPCPGKFVVRSANQVDTVKENK